MTTRNKLPLSVQSITFQKDFYPIMTWKKSNVMNWSWTRLFKNSFHCFTGTLCLLLQRSTTAVFTVLKIDFEGVAKMLWYIVCLCVCVCILECIFVVVEDSNPTTHRMCTGHLVGWLVKPCCLEWSVAMPKLFFSFVKSNQSYQKTFGRYN